MCVQVQLIPAVFNFLMQAEEAVKAQAFPHATFVRPGLLDRGEHKRASESFMLHILSGYPAAHVAHVMIDEAEKFHNGEIKDPEPNVRIISGSEIKHWKG